MIVKFTKILLTSLLTASSITMYAQRYIQPLGRMYDLDMQARLSADTSMQNVYSAVKPVLIPLDEVLAPKKDSLNTLQWLKKHFFVDDFLKFSSDVHNIAINPICHFQRTFNRSESSDNKTYFLNTRGFEAYGRLGKRIYFNTEFYENQARFTRYEDSIINVMHGIPGQGFGKAFKADGKDWAMVFGHISVDVNNNITVTLGNGKNFIGSGYRSVILSDLSFNYPFLRTDLKFGNFYYYVLWGYMQSDHWLYFTKGETRYKFASYHVAGWKPSHKLELSVVEGVMWKNHNDDGIYKYSPNALMGVPILGIPLMSYGFNNDNRVQIGFDVNYNPIKNFKLYGQYNYQGDNSQVSDEAFYGIQAGIHWFDFTFGTIDGLNTHLQLEYNYSNIDGGSNSSDFWNYGYPLTTPNVVDNGFGETILAANIEYRRIVAEGMWQHTNWSDRKSFTLRYMLNPKTKWNIYLTMQQRTVDTRWHYDNKYIVVGMSICPQNFYYDF